MQNALWRVPFQKQEPGYSSLYTRFHGHVSLQIYTWNIYLNLRRKQIEVYLLYWLFNVTPLQDANDHGSLQLRFIICLLPWLIRGGNRVVISRCLLRVYWYMFLKVQSHLPTHIGSDSGHFFLMKRLEYVTQRRFVCEIMEIFNSRCFVLCVYVYASTYSH